MLKHRTTIPVPSKGIISIFRDVDGAVYFKDSSGDIHLVDSYHDVYRIKDPRFASYDNLTGERLYVLNASSQEFIFSLNKEIAVGGGRGFGGVRGAITGINVQDDGNQVNGLIKILNFTGNGVAVTDGGGGKANIDIPGYIIASLTTAQRLALTPTTALIVEDTNLDEYFKWSTVSNSWSPF